ncbi:MAG: hypothetical protein ACLP8S_11270 [Solirubrobacteraceae bacterium]|jgi:hypothetical protein
MTRLIRTLALAGLLLGALAASGVAAVGLGEATKFTAQFNTKHTGAWTGLVLLTNGDPPEPGITEAPFVRQTVSLPQGTTVRLSALPQCNASDTALAAQGAEGACPARTRIGTGSADSVYSGLAVHYEIGIYAVRGHLVFAAEQNGQPLKQYFVGVAHGASLVLSVPTLDGKIIPTGFSARIGGGSGAQVWLRTPPSCPESHQWTVTGQFQGVSAAGPRAHPVTAAQSIVEHIACNR